MTVPKWPEGEWLGDDGEPLANGKSVGKMFGVSFVAAVDKATRAFAAFGRAAWSHQLNDTFGSTDPTIESLLSSEEK